MRRNYRIIVGFIGVVVCLSAGWAGAEESVNRVESLPPYKKMTVAERIETYIDSEKVEARYHSNFGYNRYELNDRLLQDRDFEGINKLAYEYLSNISVPYGEQEYYGIHIALRYLPDDVSMEKYEQVIREWIEVDNENWLPYLVRGRFFINRGWEARGNGFIHTVSEEHRREFSQFMNKARRDLERAYALNPKDPMSSTALLNISKGFGADMEVKKAFFENALASLPTSLNARTIMLSCLMPKWGGSWEAAKVFVQKEMGNFEENSMLVILQEDLIYQQYSFEEGSRKIYGDMELAREMIGKYRTAQERYPQSYSLKKGWFDWARRAKDYEQQYLASVAIGDTWRSSVMHKSAESYHFSRINTMRNYAKTTTGEERERLYADLLEMSHDWPSPWADLARLASKKGDNDLSLEYCEKAARLGSDSTWIYRVLIFKAMESKRYEDALKYIERAEPLKLKDSDRALYESYRKQALAQV